jgi:SDR family mycofactocin-dependent oxidoreductase
MSRFEGKTVLITGAARGQGREHAVAFAREGADVAICDICKDVATIPYALSRRSDLDETARHTEAEGGKTVVGEVDVRVWDQMKEFVDRAASELGQIDVLVANAGVFASAATLDQLTEEMWDDMIDTNVKGVWLTIKAVLPHMMARSYGRIVVTGSTAGHIGAPNFGHYTASKHALDGLVKTLALEQGQNGITANIVAPTGVGTTMILNDTVYGIFNPESPTKGSMAEIMTQLHATREPWLEPEDVTKVVLFLASDDAAKMTGANVKVDVGRRNEPLRRTGRGHHGPALTKLPARSATRLESTPWDTTSTG